MGSKKRRRVSPALAEIVTSFPRLYKRSSESPPEDLRPEDWVEVSTGEDTPRQIMSVWQTIIGLLSWAVWVTWTIYVWFFTDAPWTDLYIVLSVWIITFVITVIGVPFMRRKARNRAAE
jgi:hypothetical protein